MFQDQKLRPNKPPRLDIDLFSVDRKFVDQTLVMSKLARNCVSWRRSVMLKKN